MSLSGDAMSDKLSGAGQRDFGPDGDNSTTRPISGSPLSAATDCAHRLETIGMAAAGISHHLNTLLAGIMGNLDLAMLDAPESIRPYLEKADRATVRAAAFTARLLALVRGGETAAEPVEVGAVIDEVADFMRDITDPRFAITVKKHAPLGPAVTNSTALHHALLTLCMNARDALHETAETAPDHGKFQIEIEAKRIDGGISPSSAPESCWVAISVSDTGMGMTGEVRQHIFKPFFTTKTKHRGTGIGLATARDAITRYGGWIDANGIPDAGSTFTVYLPAASAGKEVPPREFPDEMPRGTETILLMDDDELVRGFAKAILERQGYSVFLAADGNEGLEIFLRERKRIQMVILDMVMPFVSGGDVLRRIRQSGSSPRIILTSGYDRESVYDHHEEFGNITFLVKPFSLRTLTTAVRKALDENHCSE
jgi:CheY-like chemotaxis protein